MSDTNAEQLGRLIYQHRVAVGMSQEALAKAAKMHISTVSRLEAGSFESPDPLKLQRLATALGTDSEDYFALAGYFTPHGLPGLAPYLRAKYGARPEVVREVETYFGWLQHRDETNKRQVDEAA